MGTTQFNCPYCKGQISYTLIPHKLAGGQHSLAHTVSTPYPASTPTTSQKSSFWHSDGFTYALAGLFTGGTILSFAWWYELNAGVMVASTTLLVGVGLHILKILLHRPQPVAGQSAPTVTKIRIEQWTDDNRHVLLDEIRDDRISLDDLRKVARAVNAGCNFSRPALSKVISQSKYHLIKAEFERLNYCFTTPANQTVLTPRARAFLRQIARRST